MLDDWDLIKILASEHGYSIKNAMPLVHQTKNKLEIRELTEANAVKVIQDILKFHPMLRRVRQEPPE